MSNLATFKTPRISMILSGAISLGGYEAGVVSQIAYALARWNEANPDEPPRLIIDVVAGASAGAMTGAMLARHIMSGSDPKAFVKLNHDQWCGTGFNSLLPKRSRARHSFLSSAGIDGQARELYDQLQPDPSCDRVRQRELLYTCTLTSLDAIPFDFKVMTSDPAVEFPMTGKTQKDIITFSLAKDAQNPIVEVPSGATRGSEQEHKATWARLFWVAAASGAFPLAWQPIKLHRLNEDYPPPWNRIGAGSCTEMRYTDGGVLNNVPITRAADVLSSLQEGTRPETERIYVLIEPDPEHVPATGNRDVYDESKLDGRRDDETPLLDVLGEVGDALREQSFLMDVWETQKMNRRLKARDAFFYDLIAEATNSLPSEALAAKTAEVTKQLQGFINKRFSQRGVEEILRQYEIRVPRDEKLRDGLERANLAALDASETPNASAQSASDEAKQRRDLFLLRVALADYVAGLRGKSPVYIERIFPAPSEKLGGAILGHFGGFLSPDRMHHDFLRGADDAWMWLKGWAQRRNDSESNHEPPWPVPERVVGTIEGMAFPSEEAVKNSLRPWSELSPSERRGLEIPILNRAEQLIEEELKLSLVLRWGLRGIRNILRHVVR